MEMWVLELYDEWYSCPVIVGVYTTFDNAQSAYGILMRQIKEKTLEDPTKRYGMVICPIHIDSFIDTALAWVNDS